MRVLNRCANGAKKLMRGIMRIVTSCMKNVEAVSLEEEAEEQQQLQQQSQQPEQSNPAFMDLPNPARQLRIVIVPESLAQVDLTPLVEIIVREYLRRHNRRLLSQLLSKESPKFN
ncbi:MAG: hypothetical protein MHM6MM_002378 [Cercozoa sp. M6MM]